MTLREEVIVLRRNFEKARTDPDDDSLEEYYEEIDKLGIGEHDLESVRTGDGKIYLPESSEAVLNLLTYIAGEQNIVLPNGVEWCFVEDAIYWR